MKHIALRLSALAAAVVLCGATAVLAQAAKTDVTGKWTFTVETGAGSGTPTMTFKQEGEKLTGHYSGQLGEADLVRMNAADAGVGGQSFGDGSVHALLAVAEKAGGVIAHEVDVGVTVGVGQGARVAADERQRERLVVQDRARRAAG